METTLRRIGETIGALIDALSSAWAEGAWRPEGWPATMWILLGALFVLLALLAMRRGRPRPLEVRPPQLLITQGEIIPDTAPGGADRRRRRGIDPSGSAAGGLNMTVSNLSRYPVQLLEVALREETRGAPRVAEVEAIVPAMGSVEVAVRVPLSIRGDGWIDLYCYAAAPRHKVHRHRAELVWEPWASRFKVAPMEQVATPARHLASEERQARFELADPSMGAVSATAAGVPARAAVPATAPVRGRPSQGSERAGSRGAGGDRPTAITRVADASGPASDPAAADAVASVGATAETPSLGALWDRLPDGDRPARSPDRGGGGVGPLVPVWSPTVAPGGTNEKPARVASSSISPPPRPSDAVRDRSVASGSGHEDRPGAGALPLPTPATSPRPAPGSAVRPGPAPRAAPDPLPRRPSAPAPAPGPEVAPIPAPAPASAPEPPVAAGSVTRGSAPAPMPAPAAAYRRAEPSPASDRGAAPEWPIPPDGAAPARAIPADGAAPALAIPADDAEPPARPTDAGPASSRQPPPRVVDLPRRDDPPERIVPRPARPAPPGPDAPPAAPRPDDTQVPPLSDPPAAPPRVAPPAPRRRPRLEFPDDF